MNDLERMHFRVFYDNAINHLINSESEVDVTLNNLKKLNKYFSIAAIGLLTYGLFREDVSTRNYLAIAPIGFGVIMSEIVSNHYRKKKENIQKSRENFLKRFGLERSVERYYSSHNYKKY